MSVVRFYSFGKSPAYPDCGITLAAAGPMKPGVDDENRARVFRSLAIAPDTVLAVKQIHSRIVHVADSAASFIGFPQGDGILTRNPDLVPSVTIADCMPIWLFDPVTGCFGVLHSGWKGTGILRTALELASDEWGGSPRLSGDPRAAHPVLLLYRGRGAGGILHARVWALVRHP
ncbi:MAG TPA: laccase domain-containing protein [Treponemataceae bacterium]|nr:laccase domain-containing protein [Treponemataceae bacterium]